MNRNYNKALIYTCQKVAIGLNEPLGSLINLGESHSQLSAFSERKQPK